jgi:AAHS family 4-hydroxybenzoate transporter-like MFS transporter
VFALGGVAPLLLLPLLVLLLPESPRYLIRKARPRAIIAATLNRIGGVDTFTGENQFTLSEAAAPKADLMQVFSRSFVRDTIALWGSAFTIMFASVGLISVATLVLTAGGMDQQHAIRILVIYNLAGLAGALCAFLAVHWFGSRLTMAILLAGGMAGLTLLGLHGGMAGSVAIVATTALMALVAFCLNSVLLMVFPLGAQLYPTAFRASGAGAAFSFGRIGSTISPIILTSVLAGIGPHAVYYSLAGVTLLALALVLTLQRHIRANATVR